MARQIRLFIRFVLSGTLEANIIWNTKTKLSVANLTSVPRFLRFNEVKLFYNFGQKSIEEKCRSIENSLQPLKKALKDANSILFDGIIDRDNRTHFSDHSKLLEYLSERLLKICNEHVNTIFIFVSALKKLELEQKQMLLNRLYKCLKSVDAQIFVLIFGAFLNFNQCYCPSRQFQVG